ncbi:hypothetical protein SI65_04748 [Aspergillus cristatus]|uniref:Uncharacterized protein n=1 Tax=Aspergillus cristatus TaxID=573508 RepID=A0A1E3BFM4_ASPCR|nr:hypothetical protein SI65_04748 [Aspergillus cristatus]
MPSLTALSTIAAYILVIWTVYNVIYNLWFHPLRKYPGSKLDAATRILYTFHLLRGSVTQRTKRLHETGHFIVRPDISAPQESRHAAKVTSIIRSDFPNSAGMTFLELQKHEYINAVLSEGLRLYSPAADSLFRVVPAEGGIVAGKFVPPNTSVTVNLLAAFRSPLNFHRPDEFIPELWAKDRPPEFQSDSRSVFQPFSIGKRNCLGKNLAWAEMRMIIANLLWHYNLEELMPDSMEWIGKQKIYMLWEKPDLNIRISRRH